MVEDSLGIMIILWASDHVLHEQKLSAWTSK